MSMLPYNKFEDFCVIVRNNRVLVNSIDQHATQI